MKRIYKTLVLLLLCAMFSEAKAADYVAQVGTEKYTTFKEAFEKASMMSSIGSSTTIKLLADCSAGCETTMSVFSKDITIDGGGHSLTSDKSFSINKGKLILNNLKLVFSNETVLTGITVHENSTLDAKNSTIDGSGAEQSVYIISNAGQCKFEGCELKASSMRSSEFIYNAKTGSISLSDSHIVSQRTAIFLVNDNADIQVTNNNCIFTDEDKTKPYLGKYSNLPNEIWVASLGDRVAYAGETFYTSLYDAIVASPNDATIYLLRDNTETKDKQAWYFIQKKDIIIEGNGRTITTNIQYFSDESVLTLKNLNLLYTDCPTPAAIIAWSGGTVNIYNCNIDASATKMPAVYAKGNPALKAYLNIYSGNFIGSSTNNNCTGVFVDDRAECKLYGGTFSGLDGGVFYKDNEAGALLANNNLYYVTTTANGNHLLYNHGDFSKQLINETVTVMEVDDLGGSIDNVYLGNSTPVTSYWTFEWPAVLDEYPNAIAMVNSKIDFFQSFAESNNNVLIEHDATTLYPFKTYTCANFKLTDRDANAKSTDFYTPVDFIALGGSYTRKIYKNSNSMCVPFEVSLNDFSSPNDVDLLSFAYFEPIKNTDGAYVYFSKHDAVDAGVPCFVYAAKDVTLNKTFNETPICASPLNSSCFKGTFVKTTQYQGDEDNYGINSDGTKLTSFANASLGAFRSLLNLHNDLAAMIKNENYNAKPYEINIGIDDDDATIINNVRAKENAAQDGIYTIEGQKVNSVTKRGLYIINGKKVLK